MYPQGPNYYAPPQPPDPQVAANPYYRQNFYVPPNAVAGPVPSPGLRKAKLVMGILQAFGLFVGVVLFFVFYMALLAYQIINMVWLYKMWSWVPPDQRHTKLWKKYISPAQA